MRSISLQNAPGGDGSVHVCLDEDGQTVRRIATEVSYEAIALLGSEYDFESVIDIGCGRQEHAECFRWLGKRVTTLDPVFDADIRGDLFTANVPGQYDVVWCSHVLEHQRNVGLFLDKLVSLCKPGGLLVVTVPPEISPYFLLCHPVQFSAGTLIYHMIMAGLDCSAARALTYGYNVSVVVRNQRHELPVQSWAYERECERLFPPAFRRTSSNQLLGPALSIDWVSVLNNPPHVNAHL